MTLDIDFSIWHVLYKIYQDVETKSTRIKNTLIIMLAILNKKSLHVLLADDDKEDREYSSQIQLD